VLPFANLSDQGQDLFVDGLVEDIATALTRFRSLFVVAGGSGLALKGQGLTPQQAGRLLGVHYLLDGAVRRATDRVDISVTLIDAREGVQVWSDRFEGAFAEICSLRDDVALGAAVRIEPKVQAEEMWQARAKPGPDPEAHDLFLRARALARAASRESVQQALPLYERSLELDPDNAQALVSCALALAFVVASGGAEADRLRALARERVHAALRLAPGDAEVVALAAQALQDLQEDNSTVRALAEQAIALNPGCAHGWRLSGWLWAATVPTDPDVATERLEHSLRLDPLSPRLAMTLSGLGFARLGQRRIEDAIALFRQSAELSSGNPIPYAYLAACYAQLKEFAEAHEAAARFQAICGMTVQAWADRVGASDWMKSRLARIESDP
jgi:TolB-like protein/cytochrome c-type biogenesis protein CcmH/NrfG